MKSQKYRMILASIIIFLFVYSSCMKDHSTQPVTEIQLSKAEDILLNKIVTGDPGDSIAILIYELPEKLSRGAIVRSGGKKTEYKVSNNCWFFLLDDAPVANLSHPFRYVFIYSNNGRYKIINESWPSDNIEKLIRLRF